MITNDIDGIKNEFLFVKYLNKKKISDLNPMFREFINDLFHSLNDDDEIICWRNKYRQKSDIFIKINQKIKGISIKKGMKNSIHVEPISEFIHFLITNKIERKIIISYLKYHYADGTTNGKGNNRISVDEYKKDNQRSIDHINKSINTEKILSKVVDRFITTGTNTNYSIDAIIYGEVNDFIWLTTKEIKEVILSKIDLYSSAVHFGPLTCQPKNRCLNYNPKYEKDRFCVQIKWYSLFDDIIEYKNNKLLKASF